jgi:hypothetical protein
VRAAAEAHVGDVEAVLVGGLERVHDVLGARVVEVAGEHVVVAEQRRGATPDMSYVVTPFTAPACRSCRRPCRDVRAVVLDRRRRVAALRRLVAEDLATITLLLV